MREVGLNYCRSHSCANSNRIEDHDAMLRNRKDDSSGELKCTMG